MLGYHVIPVLLLGSWVGPGSHFDGRCRSIGPIHFLDCLVRNSTRIGRASLIYIGSFAYATQRYETSAISAKCFSTAGGGCGMPLP